MLTIFSRNHKFLYQSNGKKSRFAKTVISLDNFDLYWITSYRVLQTYGVHASSNVDVIKAN